MINVEAISLIDCQNKEAHTKQLLLEIVGLMTERGLSLRNPCQIGKFVEQGSLGCCVVSMNLCGVH